VWAYGPNLRMTSARPTATSQPDEARGHHTQGRLLSERRRSARSRCDSTESDGLGNESRHFGVN
jgi:hypothetical protein